MNWMILIYPITMFVVLLMGAYGLDPTKKYRQVLINILTQVKELTPDNIDQIIDMILSGLEAQGLNKDSRIAKKMIAEVRGQVVTKRR